MVLLFVLFTIYWKIHPFISFSLNISLKSLEFSHKVYMHMLRLMEFWYWRRLKGLTALERLLSVQQSVMQRQLSLAGTIMSTQDVLVRLLSRLDILDWLTYHTFHRSFAYEKEYQDCQTIPANSKVQSLFRRESSTLYEKKGVKA